MLAIATLCRVSKRGFSSRAIRSARAERGWDVMVQADKWLMKASEKEAESLVVYPGVGTEGEHMDSRAIGSIFRSQLLDRDKASHYLSGLAHELDKILSYTRDPTRRKKVTALDVLVYMGRGRKWRVSVEYPLAAVFSISGYPEVLCEIVEGRFWGLSGEAYWTQLEDGTIATAEFTGRDDLGYVYFSLKTSAGEWREYQGEYPLMRRMEQIQPLRTKWFRGHADQAGGQVCTRIIDIHDRMS